MGRIQKWDERVLAFIQRNMHCSFLDAVMPVVSALGNFGGVWLATGLAFLCIPHYRVNGIVLLSMLSMGVLVGNICVKPFVARLRPCHRYPEWPLLVNRPKDYSFPSCHTLAAFISVPILMWTNPIIGIAGLAMAVLIAFSRMYLFVHYPSDVLAAVVMGLTMPFSAVLILVRIFGGIYRRRQFGI